MADTRTKICCRCEDELNISEFGKRSCAPDGLKYWCKKCDSKATKAHYAVNKDQILTDCKRRYKESDGRYLQQQKEYQAANPDIVKETRNKYVNKKRKTDPAFKLEITLRNRIYRVVTHKGTRKAAKTMELIGCTIEQCRVHIESLFKEGMKWGNHGDWHIDHKLPCASFDLSDPEQQRKCFHYSNLQPLWAKENLQKSSKIF